MRDWHIKILHRLSTQTIAGTIATAVILWALTGTTSRMRRRAPSGAPPEKGLVGSTAMIPTRRPCSSRMAAIRLVSELFPAPGGPVMPTIRAAPVSG